MNNRQTLNKKQVYRLQRENVDLSKASMLWIRLENNKPMIVPKEFAQWFFLPDTVAACTICPAPTFSDLMETVLPTSILTENNLRYLLTIQAAITTEGKRYKCAYMLQTTLDDYCGVPLHIYKTGEHDNALDAAYEMIITMITEGDKHLLQTHEQG